MTFDQSRLAQGGQGLCGCGGAGGGDGLRSLELRLWDAGGLGSERCEGWDGAGKGLERGLDDVRLLTSA